MNQLVIARFPRTTGLAQDDKRRESLAEEHFAAAGLVEQGAPSPSRRTGGYPPEPEVSVTCVVLRKGSPRILAASRGMARP